MTTDDGTTGDGGPGDGVGRDRTDPSGGRPAVVDVDAVCFDLDDTLFEYTQYVRHGIRSAADVVEARTGRTLHDELQALYFEAGVTDGTFDVLLDRHDLPPALVPVLVEAYHGHDGGLEPYEAAESVLDALSARYRLGLVTDGRNGRSKLRRLGLLEYFGAVCVAPEHDATKREPLPFRRVLEALDVDPRRTVYVGDDPRTDVPVPDALGMVTVRLRRGRYVDREPADGESPDAEVDDLRDLLPLLGVGPARTR